LSHPAVFTSNVQCVRYAAGRRTLKMCVTEVVLFSVVAFKTDISQGSVATHLRCCGIFSDNIITNVLLILTMK